MAERKPLQQPWTSWIDEQVRRAEEGGAFAGLEGKPIPGLDAPYDEDWWIRQWMEREQLAVVPEALDLRRRIRELEAEAARAGDERAVRMHLLAANALILRLNRMPQPDGLPGIAVVDIEAELRARRRRGEAAR